MREVLTVQLFGVKEKPEASCLGSKSAVEPLFSIHSQSLTAGLCQPGEGQVSILIPARGEMPLCTRELASYATCPGLNRRLHDFAGSKTILLLPQNLVNSFGYVDKVFFFFATSGFCCTAESNSRWIVW